MSKNVLVCFYDVVGDAVVSYQIYPSLGDFYRSVISASFDKNLPFSQFPSDYKVIVLGFIDNLKLVIDDYLNPCFEYTFSQIVSACNGHYPGSNFDTSVFLSRLKLNVSDVNSEVNSNV